MSTTAPPAKPSNWNLPNVLTVIRILAVPVFGWMLLAHPHEDAWRFGATAVFIAAMLTDLADGRIARSRNLVTDFGKLADPFADKALTGMAFVGLSIVGELWWWVTIVILIREWGITLLRSLIKKYGVMAANKGGKAKTMAQSVALVLLLLPPLLSPLHPLRWLGWIVMAVALVLTVVTGIVYCIEAKRLRDRALTGE